MKNKDVKNLLLAVNSTQNLFQYPIGNTELTKKLRDLEGLGIIKYNKLTNIWVKG